MPNYLAPGVYVQEVPSGARAIGQVNSSIAGFVGVAPDARARLDETVVLDNWTQFVDIFVGAATVGTPLSNAVYGFFNNGGGRCYVVNIGTGGSLLGTAAKPTGLRNFEKIDDISIVAAPGYADADSYAALIEHCEHPLRQDRVAILDAVEDYGPDVAALTRVATSGLPGRNAGSDEVATQLSLGPPQSPGGYAAFYVPWLVVVDPVSGVKVTQPPSGHIAGSGPASMRAAEYTRPRPTNPSRAPSTCGSASVAASRRCSTRGVNCIRYFPGEGIRVWGARTKAPEASEYRYVPVRRLTNMIKESIEEGTRWAFSNPTRTSCGVPCAGTSATFSPTSGTTAPSSAPPRSRRSS